MISLSRTPRRIILFVALAGCMTGCKQPERKHEANTSVPGDFQMPNRCNAFLTDVIVHDIISPPVASRMYAYSNLAYLEALRAAYPSNNSLLSSFNGFDTLVLPNANEIDPTLSAVLAFTKVAHALVFSKDSMAVAEKKLLRTWGDVEPQRMNLSKVWADQVAAVVLKRAANDNYKKTRGMPRYSVFGEKGKWQQTPPEYADATEPYWGMIKPLLMDSARTFKPEPPPPFDLSKNSPFYREMMEVYTISKSVGPVEDTIARFWDDNPFVTEHKGHLTYANKKMTPVGHWMGITAILCTQTRKDEYTTALAYTLCSAAIFDGFISCWEEKYRSQRIRPVTVIREQIDSEWDPILQTPSFPEYTSGHSVISAAAAVVLENIFGEKISFTDTTEKPYLGLTRNFPSIMEAANEAGISRLYGGIHFRSAITQGKIQGARIGRLYNELNNTIDPSN